MKKLILVLALIISTSAFAKVTCKTIIEDNVIYSCEFGEYVSIGIGMNAAITSCIMQYSLDPVFEIRASVKANTVTVSYIDGALETFSEKIQLNGSANDYTVSLPNGTDIQCSGVNETKH